MFRHKISPILALLFVFGAVSVPVLAVGIKQEGVKLQRYMQQYQEYREDYNNDDSPLIEV